MASWKIERKSLEQLAAGLGNNIKKGPCMCPVFRCQSLREMDKFEIRMKEIVGWLVAAASMKCLGGDDVTRTKELVRKYTTIVGMLIQSAELGIAKVTNDLLHKLECSQTLKRTVATELLMLACQFGRLELVKCLVREWKADQFRESVVGGNPLTYAAGSGQLQVAQYLVSQEPTSIDFACGDGFTPIMFGIFWSRIGVMTFLLDNGANLFLEDKFGRNALYYATLHGNVDAINFVFEVCVSNYHEDGKIDTHIELAKSSGRCVHVLAALHNWENKSKVQVKKQERNLKRGKQEAWTFRHNTETTDLHREDLIDKIEREKLPKTDGECDEKMKCGSVVHIATCPTSSKEGKNARKELQPDEDTLYWKFPSMGDTHDRALGAKSFLPVSRTVDKSGKRVKPKEYVHLLKIRPDFLREYWAYILEQAAQCTKPDKQVEYLDYIPKLMQECEDAGISVKYGKKVLGRLSKVATCREEIKSALSVGDRDQIISSLNAARGVKSMISSEFWSNAESAANKEGILSLRLGIPNLKSNSIKDGCLQSKPKMLSTGIDPSYFSESAPQLRIVRPRKFTDVNQDRQGQSFGGTNSSDTQNHVVGCKSHSPRRECKRDVPEDGLYKEVECMVCMASQRSACCIPCGHISMCYECAIEVQTKTGMCPLCRSTISIIMQIQ